MELINIEALYKAGAVTTEIKDKDVFLLGRPNSQKGDGYSLLLIDKSDFITQLTALLPIPPGVNYKIFRANLAQAGLNPPEATIFENTLSDVITWSYAGAGNYYGTLTGAFTAGKTWFISGNQADFNTITNINSENQIQISTYSELGVGANTMMFTLPILILVFD